MDYVLTYHVKKPSGGRSSRQSNLLTENAVTRSLRRGPKHLRQPGRQRPSSAGVDVELGYSGETFNSQEDHKTFRREEFERELMDMGLELEKDEDVSQQLSTTFQILFFSPQFVLGLHCPAPVLLPMSSLSYALTRLCPPYVFGRITHICHACVLSYLSSCLPSIAAVLSCSDVDWPRPIELADLCLVGVGGQFEVVGD